MDIPLVCKADPSQYEVIMRAISDRSMVVEGPPGTGKSQTIANIIAACVARGQSVLFLAAKETALAVVAKRLSDVGLGPFLLPLHAHGRSGTSLKDLSASVAAAFEAKSAGVPDHSFESSQVRRQALQRRQALNRVAGHLRHRDERSRLTVSQAMWKASHAGDAFQTRMRQLGLTAELPSIADQVWSQGLDQNIGVAEDFLLRLKVLEGRGDLTSDNAWRGLSVNRLSESDVSGIVHSASMLERSWIALWSHALPPGLMPAEVSPAAFLVCRAALASSELVAIDPLGTEREIIADLEGARATILDFSDGIQHAGQLQESLGITCSQLPSLETLQDLSTTREEIAKRLPVWRNAGNQLDLDGLRRQLVLARSVLAQVEQAVDLFIQLPHADPWSLPVTNLRCWLQAVRLAMASAGIEWSLLRADFTKVEATDLVTELRSAAQKLATDEQELLKVLDITCLPDDAGINQLKSDLRQDGWWSSRFGTQRKACKRAQRFLQKPLGAGAILQALGSYQELRAAQARLDGDDRAKRLFGTLFLGRSTRWERIEQSIALVRALVNVTGVSQLPTVLAGNQPRGDIALLDAAESAFTSLEEAIRQHAQLAEHGFMNLGGMRWREVISGLDAAIGEISGIITWYDGITWEPWRRIPFGQMEPCLRDATELATLTMALRQHRVRDVIGSRFHGLETPLDEVKWIQLMVDTLERIKSSCDPSCFTAFWTSMPWDKTVQAIKAWLAATAADADEAQKWSSELMATGMVDDQDVFHATSCTLPMSTWLERLHRRCSRPQDLTAWMALSARLKEGADLGLGPMLDHLLNRRCDIETVGMAFRANAYHGYVERLLVSLGITHDEISDIYVQNLRSEFRQADGKLLSFNPARVIQICLERKAEDDGPSGMKISQMRGQALLKQITTNASRIPVRDVIGRAKGALLACKPCWLMSPGSVSQYLPKKEGLFDVLIVDEASQLRTSEVAPAALRCKRMLIFGDTKQMPPSQFGRSSYTGSQSEYDICESVLERAAISLPSVTLKWHYRSQHEDLIRYSNRHFYKDQLVVFPCTNPLDPTLGMFHEFAGGCFVGKRNQIEAQKVVEIMRTFMIAERSKPMESRRTVGVVAMNAEQRDHIKDLVEQYRMDNPDFHQALMDSESSIEPFFITNLESVQGDERDHIIISCTYGPEEPGQRTKNFFGPITNPGGERRLNVLFTRARQRITVVTSMHPHDITSNTEGARHFRGFIAFAKDKRLTDQGIKTNHEADSPFEESVGDFIRANNYKVVPQVGVDGFRIDLAIEDPVCQGRYLLGIECDGASYHSSRSARDRDRLRQEILEGRGWIFHRVWSTDWFHDRPRAEQRLLAAIASRIEEVRQAEAELESVVLSQSQSQAVAGELDDGTIDDTDDAHENTGDGGKTIPEDHEDEDATEPQGGDLTPETILPRLISQTIRDVLGDKSYLKREALVKAVCQVFNFDIRKERRSRFSRRVWRQVVRLKEQRVVRIGGTNDDCASLRNSA